MAEAIVASSLMRWWNSLQRLAACCCASASCYCVTPRKTERDEWCRGLGGYSDTDLKGLVHTKRSFPVGNVKQLFFSRCFYSRAHCLLVFLWAPWKWLLHWDVSSLEARLDLIVSAEGIVPPNREFHPFPTLTDRGCGEMFQSMRSWSYKDHKSNSTLTYFISNSTGNKTAEEEGFKVFGSSLCRPRTGCDASRQAELK